GCQSSTDATGGGSVSRGGHARCRLACRGEPIQTAPRPVLARGNRRIFPLTLQKTHLLQAAERTIQRAVRRQQAFVRDVAEPLREFVPVKFFSARLVQPGRRFANGPFERDQPTSFSSHAQL